MDLFVFAALDLATYPREVVRRWPLGKAFGPGALAAAHKLSQPGAS